VAARAGLIVSHDRTEVIKNFTRGRKFPQLIGRTPDGKKIIGGPYTLPQVVGGGVAALILWVTRAVWLGGLVWNVGFFLAVVLGTVFAMGKLRLGGRSPASVLQGVARAVVIPHAAKINGRPVRPRRARLVHAGCRIHPVPGGVAHRRDLAEPPHAESIPATTSASPRTEQQTTEPETSTVSPHLDEPPLPSERAGNGAAPPRRARSSVKELLALASGENR